jgi:hypothetical protein
MALLARGGGGRRRGFCRLQKSVHYTVHSSLLNFFFRLLLVGIHRSSHVETATNIPVKSFWVSVHYNY